MSKIPKITLLHQELLEKVKGLSEDYARECKEDPSPPDFKEYYTIRECLTKLRGWYSERVGVLESPFSCLKLHDSNWILRDEGVSYRFRHTLMRMFETISQEMGLEDLRYLTEIDNSHLEFEESILENLQQIFRQALGECRFLSNGLCDLVRRPYWRRVWIIQEIVLSPHIELFCGSKTAPWDGLRYLLRLCDDRATDESARSMEASMATTLCREWENRHATSVSPTVEIPRGFKGLENVLDGFEDSICADIRDKIYGLLGLVETSLEADYYKTPIQLFAHLMTLFDFELSQDRADGQEHRISNLLHFGRLLSRTLKLDVYGSEGSPSTNEYGTILRMSGASFGAVLLSDIGIENSEESETNFLDSMMADVSAGESETQRTHFRTNAFQCIQRLKRVIPLLLAESTRSIDYTQFRSDVTYPEAAITLISLSYSPADCTGSPAWSKPSTGKVFEFSWFVYAHGCIGVSDVDVREGDLICNCSSVGPTHALVMRESLSGLQVVGRAMLSGTPSMRGRGSLNTERQLGQREIKFSNLEISFDAISLLAFVVFPSP